MGQLAFVAGAAVRVGMLVWLLNSPSRAAIMVVLYWGVGDIPAAGIAKFSQELKLNPDPTSVKML
jgi:hypothetical protein